MNTWLLLSLLLSHIIGDFYLQTDKGCKNKVNFKYKSSFLYIHSLIIGAVSWAMVPSWDFGWYALIIAVSHLIIDTIKTYTSAQLWAFLLDQAAHVAILCTIAAIYVHTDKLPIQYVDFSSGVSMPLLATGILLSAKPTNILIKLILERYRIGENNSCKEIKNAGALIGNLERIISIIFVLIGHYEAIGFIIAAKSLLRFKDTDTAKTEYVLAGTFLSFGTAITYGLLIKHLSTFFI